MHARKLSEYIKVLRSLEKLLDLAFIVLILSIMKKLLTFIKKQILLDSDGTSGITDHKILAEIDEKETFHQKVNKKHIVAVGEQSSV